MDGTYYAAKIKSQNDSIIIIESKDMGSFSIKKSDVQYIEFEESGIQYFNKTQIKVKEPNNSYKAGSSVFVSLASDRIVGRAGKRKLKELIESGNKWKVVDCDLEADFIAHYIFDDSGADHAYVEFRTRDNSLLYKSPSVKAKDLVPRDAGYESVTKLYKR